MGARIAVFNRASAGGEPVGDLEVEAAELTATSIGAEEVPSLVDELPLFALAAGMARGDSVVTGAQELRVKEIGPCRKRERCAAATGRAHRNAS